jgi:hypothetical protein
VVCIALAIASATSSTQAGCSRVWPPPNRGKTGRRWLPRQIDIDKVSDEEIQDIVLTANLTPRKCHAIPGDPQRAWQRRANPVLIDPLHLAPESTHAHIRDEESYDSRRAIPCKTLQIPCSAPPFLGGKVMRRGRRLKTGKGSGPGDEYVDVLFRVYEDRVSAEADFVCYWFAKAFEAMRAGRVSRVGLVATNSIRGDETTRHEPLQVLRGSGVSM